MTLFSKFLNVSQLESLLQNSIVTPNYFSPECEHILKVLSTHTTQVSGLKHVFQAVFNCFDAVLSPCTHPDLPLISVRYFKHLLQPVFSVMTKQFCDEFQPKIAAFFKQAFALPQVYFKLNRTDY